MLKTNFKRMLARQTIIPIGIIAFWMNEKNASTNLFIRFLSAFLRDASHWLDLKSHQRGIEKHNTDIEQFTYNFWLLFYDKTMRPCIPMLFLVIFAFEQGKKTYLGSIFYLVAVCCRKFEKKRNKRPFIVQLWNLSYVLKNAMLVLDHIVVTMLMKPVHE